MWLPLLYQWMEWGAAPSIPIRNRIAAAGNAHPSCIALNTSSSNSNGDSSMKFTNNYRVTTLPPFNLQFLVIEKDSRLCCSCFPLNSNNKIVIPNIKLSWRGGGYFCKSKTVYVTS